MNLIEHGIVANEAKIAIVVARFNRFINNSLLDGALDVFKRLGCIKENNITVIWCPGSYELPLITKVLAVSCKYSAILVLGTIIRGYTLHFEYVAKECSVQLSNISIENMVPIGFGLIIANDINQAIERSGIKNNNKGSEAALAILEMINILKMIRE